MTHRISWIDICKGIGILCVLYAHGLDSNSIRYLFYSFHIPLFFFLSGVVFHHKNHENFIYSFKKALKGIIKPYLLFTLGSLAIWYIMRGLPILTIDFFIEQIKYITYGNGSSNQYFYNVVLWFLPCLFATRLLFTSFLSLTQQKKHLLALVGISAVTGYLLSIITPELKLPLGLETAFSAVVFFGTGYLWNSNHGQIKNMIHPKAARIFIFSLILWIIIASINFHLSGRQIDMRLNYFSNIFLFYPAAFLGILSSISLSHLLEENKFLEYLGKHSMQLFIWHLFIFSFLSKILLIFMSSNFLEEIRNTLLAPFYTVISSVIILILYKMIRRVKENIAKQAV